MALRPSMKTGADGVSPVRFLDDRLPKGVALYTKFNMGFGLPWVPTFSETDPAHVDYGARYDHISPRGRGSFGPAMHYYYYKGIGLDMTAGWNRYIKAGFDATASNRERARSGQYLDSIHNYGFDFWIGLPAAASDAATRRSIKHFWPFSALPSAASTGTETTRRATRTFRWKPSRKTIG